MRSKRLVLLCDGTWCGRETGTRTNVFLLAKLFGINISDADSEGASFGSVANVREARYRHGVGLNSTFIDYIFNGVTAQDLAEECINVYRFIVKHYTDDHEIWLFGLSRGAYTVRCVAGMINNCGIIRERGSDEETSMLCKEVYRIYRSRYDINKPHSKQSIDFRKRSSWPLIGDGNNQVLPPVKFMGLFDTVGDLGIPTFTGGVGLDWPEFYDKNVSSVVEQVCHLVSLHDRFYIFQPCLASREKKWHKIGKGDFGIYQKWLPGVHYDVGRQKFRFFRSGAGILENFLSRWTFASKVIEPNEVLGDLALLEMLKKVRDHDPSGLLISTLRITAEIDRLRESIAAPIRDVGDGDIYQKVVEYIPFGQIIGDTLSLITHGMAGMEKLPAVWQLFFATRDRLIPQDDALVYDFREMDPDMVTVATTEHLATISQSRYPSRTFESWKLRA